jgi:hypothetical protein
MATIVPNLEEAANVATEFIYSAWYIHFKTKFAEINAFRYR